MNARPVEISRNVAGGTHAVLTLDGKGRQGANAPVLPDILFLLSLPPGSPELNPVENIWPCLCVNWLMVSVFDRDDAIAAASCAESDRFTNDPYIVTSISSRTWAKPN